MRKLKKQKRRMHRGIDLRSKSFLTWKLQDVVASERSLILRLGTDRKGNGFIVVQPLESEYDEIKYIHVTIETARRKGEVLHSGEYIGKTEVKGSSKAHHLHWETWLNGKAIDPIKYLDKYNIKYKYKRKQRTK